MSDGPHYSLDAQKWWKDAAKAADKHAYSAEDVGDATVNAIVRDCKRERVPEAAVAISEALKDVQSGLFDRDNSDRLIPVLNQFAGYELARRFIERTQDELRDGRTNLDALERGFEGAAYERCDREVGAMEEHYLKESNRFRSNHLRTRMDHAIDNLSAKSIISGFLGSGPFNMQSRHNKKTGLDDGVQI